MAGGRPVHRGGRRQHQRLQQGPASSRGTGTPTPSPTTARCDRSSGGGLPPPPTVSTPTARPTSGRDRGGLRTIRCGGHRWTPMASQLRGGDTPSRSAQGPLTLSDTSRCRWPRSRWTAEAMQCCTGPAVHGNGVVGRLGHGTASALSADGRSQWRRWSGKARAVRAAGARAKQPGGGQKSAARTASPAAQSS